MKNIILLIAAIKLSYTSVGQVKHYFSYNAVIYADLFNKQKDKSYFPKSFLGPSITYKISKHKFHLEFNFLSRYGQNYYPKWEKGLIPDSSKLQVLASLFNLNINYTLIEKKWVVFNVGTGISRRWLDVWYFYHWGSNLRFIGDILFENNNGFNSSLNIVLPIYRGIHLNNTARYLYFPNSTYSKQNFIWEVGIGYMFQRKRNKPKI